MTDQNTPKPSDSKKDFAAQADAKQPGALRELWGFMAQNKKWWLTPILLALALLGLLIVMGGSGAAPFIYTLF